MIEEHERMKAVSIAMLVLLDRQLNIVISCKLEAALYLPAKLIMYSTGIIKKECFLWLALPLIISNEKKKNVCTALFQLADSFLIVSLSQVERWHVATAYSVLWLMFEKNILSCSEERKERRRMPDVLFLLIQETPLFYEISPKSYLHIRL